ncbi:chemokine-like protein TAFA-5 isoform X1 [Sarcophilus harrisii]|uniref:chemokine-like protein TAFA-5 isoform X1 n=1 Tax=Sarcophilus harrisii TaxID=9305 RepID=UPI001302020F|nr:chemokine-like protein TAFA-5 isoform X1 [Sarcophilus harrisii]
MGPPNKALLNFKERKIQCLDRARNNEEDLQRRQQLLNHLSCLQADGQLAAGTCEIVTLDRDSSQPRRTIARQTARCACKRGQIAGTTRARPACVDARIIKTKQWCDMLPCLEGEGCDLLINRSGWTCTQPGGRIKTTTVS